MTDREQTTGPCPSCDAAGHCTFECLPDAAREDRQRMAGMAAILRAGLSNMVGQRVTPDLMKEITESIEARITILDQLLEPEIDG